MPTESIGIGRRRRGRIAGAVALFLAAALSSPPGAAHERIDPQDRILQSIGVDEHLGDPVPGEATFRDQTGKIVRLDDYFGHGPILLTLNYYTCPMLCPITLRNLLGTVNSIRGISLDRDYRIVTVSFDPDDTLESARARADEIHGQRKGAPHPGDRWPFLIGAEPAIRALTGAVGFRYRKVGKEFAHPDVGVVLTPEGRISRYLYGLEQDPRDLKLALIEASGGRIGESQTLNRVLLYCFHYDPVGKKYALYAKNIMTAGGIFTLVFLGMLYLSLRVRRKRDRPDEREQRT